MRLRGDLDLLSLGEALVGGRGERIGLAGVEVDVGAGGIGGETGTTRAAVVIFLFAELGFVYFYDSANSANLRLRGNTLSDPLVHPVEEPPNSVLFKVGLYSSSLHRISLREVS